MIPLTYLVHFRPYTDFHVVIDRQLDLTTRSGLKKVHSNFNKVYADMDKLYESNMDNLKIRGAIVLIYAKMCVDTILRDKLFEKGRYFE